MKSAPSKSLLTAALVAAFAATPALAQTQQSSGSSAASTARSYAQAGQQAGRDMRASEVIGKQVKNPQGENLGDIEDLIINIDNQRVQYVLMSFDGTLGLGDKQLALPVDRLRAPSAQGEALVLNATKEELQQAPGFTPNKRPNFSDETYRGAVDRYFFKEETTRHTAAGARLMSAEELIGRDVNDRAAHEAGEIEDLVVNLGSGRAYLVFEVDKSWSPKEKLVALPLDALSFLSRPDLDPLLNIDRPLLEKARPLEKNVWSDLNSATAQKQINEDLMRMQAQVKSNPGATSTGRETSSGASR